MMTKPDFMKDRLAFLDNPNHDDLIRQIRLSKDGYVVRSDGRRAATLTADGKILVLAYQPAKGFAGMTRDQFWDHAKQRIRDAGLEIEFWIPDPAPPPEHAVSMTELFALVREIREGRILVSQQTRRVTLERTENERVTEVFRGPDPSAFAREHYDAFLEELGAELSVPSVYDKIAVFNEDGPPG